MGVTRMKFLPKWDVLQRSVKYERLAHCTKEHASFWNLKIRPEMTELLVIKWPNAKLNFFPGKHTFRELIFISFEMSPEGL